VAAGAAEAGEDESLVTAVLLQLVVDEVEVVEQPEGV
jgi:hypothetical protein